MDALRRWTGKIVIWGVFILIFLLWLSVAHAETHVVKKDGGGNMVEYINKYGAWATKKDSVVVAGQCDSSCTIMLGLIEPDLICATRHAEFGFHSAMDYFGDGKAVYSEIGTQTLWFFYTNVDRVQRVLAKHGWSGPSNHPKLILIEAQEMVRPCTEDDYGRQNVDGDRGKTGP